MGLKLFIFTGIGFSDGVTQTISTNVNPGDQQPTDNNQQGKQQSKETMLPW